MNKNLLILGAGQYGAVAKEIAEDMQCFEKIDFLDDNSKTAVGKFSDLKSLIDKYSNAIVAVGNCTIRRKLFNRLIEVGYIVPALISPKAFVSKSAMIADGCIIEPLAGINANTEIGKGCIISMSAVINHNAVIGDFCHIDCGAIIKSGVTTENGIKINAGTVVEN